ncbi:MAG: exonuclease domain-containing protein [Bacillota bacterium]|nr:exonuclease domain-containing protein [Bacillota bacterium]
MIVDVETTGLRPGVDEVIEVALLQIAYERNSGKIVDIIEESTFLREPISYTAKRNYSNAYKVHGIPYGMVEGKAFDDAKILQMITDSKSVFAHNASFDRSFLYHLYPEINDLLWYCTMRNVPWKSYGFTNSKLLTLLEGHKISFHQTHRALDDITMLMKLLRKNNPKGELYLKEVIEKKPMKKYEPRISTFSM